MKSEMGRGLTMLALAVLALPGMSAAQPTTMGLIFSTPQAFPGYTLFAPMLYTETYLIDNDGLLVHSWPGTHPAGNTAYLLDDGTLLRGATVEGGGGFNQPGGAGLIEQFDWDGNLIWEFEYNTDQYRYHHDFAPMPNGNVLVIAWELRTEAEALQAGRDPTFLWEGELWPERIIEVQPTGASGGIIVWQWQAWDHLIQDYDATKDNFGVVEDHPELVDINYGTTGNADWLHANAIDYHPDLDQIVISVNSFNEFWVIDHGTTTEEAAGHTGGARGHGGDILYRWGNPQAYGRGTFADRNNYRQHDVQWIAPGLPGEGHLLFFNNGNGRPEGAYSSVEELVTTIDGNGDYPVPAPGVPHGPAAAAWVFTATPPESLYSGFISGAVRLPNGNTLICEGASGQFHEVDSTGTPVWQYISPVDADGPMVQGMPPTGNRVFRARRFAPDYPAFDGRDLTPGEPIELYLTGVEPVVASARFELRPAYPNPFRPSTTISFRLPERAPVALEIHDVTGRRVATLVDGRLAAGDHGYEWRPRGLASGVYLVTLRVGSESATRRMTLLR